MKEVKHFRRLKILASDLSSRGNLESALESELELELLGIKFKSRSQTFPPNHLSRVKLGI